jgi:predicted HicB family RNase H-like nuclease
MITMKSYKGYVGQVVSLDPTTGLFHGRVSGMRDVITFEASDAAGLQREFEASVDDYLSWAKDDGFTPEKPASGVFQVRTGPAIHGRLNEIVAKSGAKLNTIATRVLAHGLELGLEDERVFEELRNHLRAPRTGRK